jgi:hypothetical protein
LSPNIDWISRVLALVFLNDLVLDIYCLLAILFLVFVRGLFLIDDRESEWLALSVCVPCADSVVLLYVKVVIRSSQPGGIQTVSCRLRNLFR